MQKSNVAKIFVALILVVISITNPLISYSNEIKSGAQKWTFTLDNDFLVPGTRDQDYTGGLSVNYSGKGANSARASLSKPLKAIDNVVVKGAHSRVDLEVHSVEFGLFGFTPEDTTSAQAQQEDRPYASLVYLSSSREQVDLNTNTAWNTSLTVGVLGLNAVGSIQNAIHGVVGSDEADGWDNQISDGGEPTARYTVAHQRYIDFGRPGIELKTARQLSLGYITEASWSANLRLGRIDSGWWSFSPEAVVYGEQSGKNGSVVSSRDSYVWAGFAIKARAYNAFLQGQFRSSDVSYDFDELNHILVEGWLGYTQGFDNGYQFSYVLRGHSSEIEDGDGDRNLLWGGVILSKTL